MTITEDTKLVEIDSTEDIVEALEILGGTALLSGNRTLYDHILRAKVQYGQGIVLNRTTDIAMKRER